MLVLGFPAGSFSTNAYVIARGPGHECLIVDPGQRSAGTLHRLVTEHRLQPEAILLTHGHMDHTWDVLPLSERYDVPVYIHTADRFMLGAPAKGLPDTFPQDLLAGHPNAEPTVVRPCGGDEAGAGTEAEAGTGTGTDLIDAAGLTVRIHHVAGHTAGSVMYHIESGESLLITGDALLAGSLGRSDGPGGDAARLRRNLEAICTPLDDATRLLTGHGEPTTLGRERELHAFL